MNTSFPVSAFVSGVSYGFLSRDDVRQLSARRITSAVALDTLLNPVPGGLYTPELGQFADNPCATCGLKNPQCPGHCGHIELPVPCYHPTFMDQVLRLLRATCVYCHKFRMSRNHVNKYICKFRLVQRGLLQELQDIDDLEAKLQKKGLAKADDDDEDSADDNEAGYSVDVLTEARLALVKKAIERSDQEAGGHNVKSEAVSAERKQLVASFLADVVKPPKCMNCGGVEHKYRKDRFTKIFRKPLKDSDRTKMIQSGLKIKEPVVVIAKRKRAGKDHPRKRARQEDEGIADMDRSSEEETSESDEEVEIAGGDTLVEETTVTKKKKTAQDSEVYLNPSRVLAQLNELFIYEQPVLALLYGKRPNQPSLTADMFFLQDILVPPNRYRPEARQGKNEVSEAQANTLYKSIITASEQLVTIQRELQGAVEPTESSRRYRARTYADFEYAWVTLQDAVNSMIDKDRNPVTGAAAKRNPEGVKQVLEKKEGLFRKNMMGKRVNFAARTVISPDPNIETNEIGVPPVFAHKLTYPEPVTSHNLEELQEAVRNGPQLWPGAAAIENENGQIISLERKNPEERTALANQLLAPSVSNRGRRPKKVYRHLINGDIVIMNRQPTLHKPSMMCHRARVLPGEKTLRMHYANCNTYNADFDGDEMNMHFPQNEIARAEALSIADTDHQYLSATAGKPLRGLIQDHISICVILTSRDTFFNRSDYMQLLYAALRPESGHCTSGRVLTVPPAVMKPKKLWTGKQVITSVLENIKPIGTEGGLCMSSKSQTPAAFWSKTFAEEEKVIFKDGYLVSGILDKKQIGPAAGGFVHSVFEIYGHTIAGRLLSVLGRLLTKMLHMRAHSCGVADLIFSREGEVKRQDALKDSATVGHTVSSQYVSLDGMPGQEAELKRRLEDVLRDDEKQEGLDKRMKGALANLSSAVTMTCLPDALVKPFPRNQMQLMTGSGAKGTEVNANQISCNLGQQVLEGRRVPVMVSGKTLPCFKPFEPSARAGGYIVDRFLTGVRPQEFFFHAMAGREGLIDTAVKTSRSGYLQRCLIKGMEGLKVQHDTSVRDSDGSVVQFLYGEDGLEVVKAKYLSDYTFASQNYLSLLQSLGVGDGWENLMSADARDATKSAEKRYRKTDDLAASDPGISVYNPAQHAGAMSEKVFSTLRKYLDENPDKTLKDKKQDIDTALTKKKFQAIQELRYLRSIAEAGEAVGVVAGQSVGEPSTQMTLNTFHLAGHSTKNVTLGIPRLRELVMTAAANISTPLMTLRLTNDISEDDARKFAKGISKLSLAEILDKVSIKEKTGQGRNYGSAKIYEVTLELFPQQEYLREYAITKEDVETTLEHRFLPRLQASIRKEMRRRGEEKTLKAASSDALPDIGKGKRVEQATGDPDADREDGADDSDVDDDAANAKQKNNQRQGGYDDEADDDERDVADKLKNAEDKVADDEAEAPHEDEAYHSQDTDDSDSDSELSAEQRRRDEAEARIKANKHTSDVGSYRLDESAETCVFTLEYSAETAKVLMLNLVEDAARAALVQSVPGLSTADYDPEASKLTGAAVVLAEGSNIKAMWDYQHIVHPYYLYTNNVHEVLATYGVEAARSAIHREIHSVFDGHGISVDARHLTLIADYMTRGGGYSPFNRNGYRSNTSPFMKMSFETTVGFLRDAVLEGDSDDLTNPSARIVVGRMNNVGTGGFDVFNDLTRKTVEVEMIT